jgi:hypothetical protein
MFVGCIAKYVDKYLGWIVSKPRKKTTRGGNGGQLNGEKSQAVNKLTQARLCWVMWWRQIRNY